MKIPSSRRGLPGRLPLISGFLPHLLNHVFEGGDAILERLNGDLLLLDGLDENGNHSHVIDAHGGCFIIGFLDDFRENRFDLLCYESG